MASAAGPQNSGNVNYFFHIIVFLCITFLFGKLDPIAPLTLFGMNTIGVFLGVIYAWVFIDIIWPSMVGLLALMLLDVLPATALLNKGFGDPTVIMMMFIFVFSATLDRYGLAKYISLWFVSRKCVMGKPWRLTFALLLAIAILGGLTSATPAAVIGWSLLYGVFDICGYKKGDGYPIMMIIGTVFAAQLGMSLVPFKSLPLVAISAYEKLSGTSVDYALYLLASLTTCLFCLLLFIALGKHLFRPDVSKLESLDIKLIIKESDMTLTGIQKLRLGFLVALIIFMMLPGFLPKDLAVTIFFKKIGNTGVCILLVALLCAIRVKGKALLPWRAMVNEGVAWPIIFILAFTLPLAGPLSDPKAALPRSCLRCSSRCSAGFRHDLCALHGHRGRHHDAVHQQYRSGRGAHACGAYLLLDQRRVVRTARHPHHHRLLPGLPHARRKLHSRHAARQRLDQHQKHLENRPVPYRALAHRCERGGHPHRQGVPVADPPLPLLFQKQGQAPTIRAWPCVSRNPSFE